MHRPLLRRPPPYQSALWQRRNVAVATSQRLTIFHRCRRYLLISFSLVVLAGFATGPAAGANRVDLCGSIATDTVLTAGSVYVLTCVTTVEPQATLRLEPGAVIKLAIGSYNPAELVIRGNLEVMGTAEAPVVFTSLQDDQYGGDTNGDGPSFGEPGQWSAITFASGSRGRISHAIIRYGGGYYYHYSTKALIRNFSNDVALDHVELSRSRLHGVYTENGPMALRNCKITGNAGHGILNYTPRFTVDARYNWWGDASGPLHTRNNPNGSGDRVSDGVLFFPWAVDEYGAIPTQVLIQGPTRISPGDTVEYAVSYFVTQPLQEAVLVVDLPAMARYLDATGDAVLWPERNQVYWRLGDRGPAEGSRSLRLLYEWGLPDGSSDNILARLLALNLPAEAHLDVNEYLQHNPRLVTAEVLLSDSELRTQLTAHGDLSHLFEAAIGDGFLAPRARWLTTNLGERVLEVMLIAPERGAVIYLALHDGTVAALRYDRSTFQVYDVHGGLEWDVELDRFTFRGSWRSEASPTRGSRAVASFSRCFFNCAAPKLSLAVIKKTFKSVGVAFKLSSCFSCGFSQGANVEACAKCENAIKPLLRVDYLPGLGENVPVLGELIDVTKCASSCAGQQGVVFPCTAPLLTCDTSVTRHIWTHVFEQCSYRRIPCESGVLVPEKSHVVNSGCATDFCKCVEGKGCQRCSGAPRSYLPLETRTCDGTAERAGSEAASTGKDRATTQADSACSIARTAIRVAHDPNAKHSPAGDVVPGQELVYSVEYENTGAGRAYGVYIVDQLDPHLDETTLDLAGNGSFSPATRTIVWDIGELPAAGEEGAKGEVTFRVRVRSDVPAGTVITNQATVHFPSVPEETRTNATVNVVQPLVAIPQTLETFYRTALPLDLSGGDLFGSPLRYSIIDGPLNGTLSGLPPTLVYMPFENFTGPDWFAFVVANETKRSRPARVTIFVHPSSADRVPPQVLWTYPEHGSFLHEVPTTPFLQDEHGPLYAPSVRVGFSEAMDPNTITEASVTVTTTTGRQVATLVRWDDVSNQAVALPREPWQDGSYVATVNTAVRDASGNALPAEHSWSFGILTASSCVGDCNGDKEVTIDELVKGVNIALGIASLADCVAFETNDDGTVTVDELIQGVNAALTGCGA